MRKKKILSLHWHVHHQILPYKCLAGLRQSVENDSQKLPMIQIRNQMLNEWAMRNEVYRRQLSTYYRKRLIRLSLQEISYHANT
jgi:hypothetical protein